LADSFAVGLKANASSSQKAKSLADFNASLSTKTNPRMGRPVKSIGRQMGGLCFMVNGKMCVGVEKNRLMARIGPEAYDDTLTRKGCRPMDFTGHPMRGFVFVEGEGVKSAQDLAFWLELALAFNPTAKESAKKRR
jgi:hypothetical protein